jgi:uncharacterized repeat protein (TIGR01451 family)
LKLPNRRGDSSVEKENHNLLLEETMKTCFRIFTITCLLLGWLTIQPQTAIAQAAPLSENEMPSELQEAFLAASAKPFSTQGGTYTTEYNGLNYQLTTAGLQAEGDGIQWGISLRGMGRGKQADDVGSPEVVQTEERLEYQRDVVTEWYRDTALGVEQGFTISESPQGNGKLVLHLDLSTDLEGQLNEDERGISFAGADGLTLHYDNLKAYDANGAELEAKMVYNPAQVVIHVDDRDAAYPITIDPLIYLEQKVTASDGSAYDWLEAPVAISGDTAVVGAQCDDIGGNSNQGSAYVFVRDGETWTQQAKLTALDGDAEDLFGASVAIYGDTVLVGAYWDNVEGRSDQGSAYIFVRNGTTWTQQAKLTASDGVTSDPSFGYSVALSGDTALVGALGNAVQNKGSAYIFVRNGTTWTEQAKLTASGSVIGDSFGGSVALSGDKAIIGATGVDVGANSAQGSAYVFVRTGTTWSQTAHLTASDGAPNDHLGNSVAISGDTVVVGAMGDDSSISEDVGSAYVFVRNGTNWTEEIKLGHALWGSEANDRFGSSVAIYGDTVLVGAEWDNVGGISAQGSAYIFVRSGGTWLPQYKLTASDGAASDHFGFSVAISGDTAMVGAYGDDSAYFYTANRTDSDLAILAANATGNPVQTSVTLNLSVTNNGPANATAVMVDASLPAGMSYVSHTTSAGTYTYRNGSWSLGNLASGATATLSIVAAVGAIPGQTRTFTATILSTDTNNNNNTASALVQVSVGVFNKINPANSAIDQPTNVTLNWQASTGATAYSYCIGEGVANLCKTSPIPWVGLGTVTSVSISGLKQGTIYSWHVRASNSYSTTYSNGDYWSFTTGTQPEAFSKSNPANGSTNRPVELSLSWGPSWSASEYQYCYDISNDDTCNNGGTWTSVNATLNSVTVSGLIFGQTYYWQVRAINPIGETYANSDWWSFTTGNPSDPFGKNSPVYGATNQVTNPTLIWGKSNGATSYQYCYDRFDDGECTGSWTSVPAPIFGSSVSVTLDGLTGNTTYYWQVRALNSIGSIDADSHSTHPWWSFTTGDTPDPFGKINPINGAVIQRIDPTLSWGLSIGATSYQYCYDKYDDDECTGSWISVPVPLFGVSVSVTLNGLEGGTTYYWQVRALNSIGPMYADSHSTTPWWSFTTIPLKVTKSFYSTAPQDGWILESSETSGQGGSVNATASTLRLGDNAAKSQYRSILSFSTGSGLPDGAIITTVTLKIRRQGVIGGGNPITTFQGFMVDIKKGYFGTTALQTADFQTAASKTYGPFKPALSNSWYSIDLTSGKNYINKVSSYSGLTQIRLRFKLDDNNNRTANYLSLYSGNASSSVRPQLIVEYYVP